MTKTEYASIAAALARTRPDEPRYVPTTLDNRAQALWSQWSVTRDAIIGVMMLHDPKFDRPAFIRATEVEE